MTALINSYLNFIPISSKVFAAFEVIFMVEIAQCCFKSQRKPRFVEKTIRKSVK